MTDEQEILFVNGSCDLHIAFYRKEFNLLPKYVVFPFLLDENTRKLVGIPQYRGGEGIRSCISSCRLMSVAALGLGCHVNLQALVTVKVNVVLKSCLIFTLV